MAKKQALGRGLSALLSDHSGRQVTDRPAIAAKDTKDEAVIGQMAGDIALLEIRHIEANEDQPRRDFDEKELGDLAQSIRELGIIQPITVRRIRANKYQIISGERRFRASQLAGLESLPAYIREADDQTLLEMALVENIQRQDLHAMEVATSFQRLMEECNLTQEELAKRVGKDRSTISNYINLMRLPAEMQLAVAQRQISMGHARALKGIDDVEWQQEVFDLVVGEGLSVRQTEELARNNRWESTDDDAESSEKKGKRRAQSALSTTEQAALEELTRKFGRRARLKSDGSGSGKIELKYTSQAELDAILEGLNL
jgi:ParB family chromosome partitioning protein